MGSRSITLALLAIGLINLKGLAQAEGLMLSKPIIDSSVYDKWPAITGGAVSISNDGKYVTYPISNLTPGFRGYIIVNVQTSQKIIIPGVSGWCVFSPDSRFAFMQKAGDSLSVITLSSLTEKIIPDVLSFKIPKKGPGGWLAYQRSSSGKELIVQNLINGKRQVIAKVIDYLYSEDGSKLLMQTKADTDRLSLQLLSLNENEYKTIWEGNKAGSFIFDGASRQLAFIGEENINNQMETSVWYYKIGTDKAKILVDKKAPGITDEQQLGNIVKFSKDGKRIFINLVEKEQLQAKADAVKVDVWSYTDARLQSQQLAELSSGSFLCVIHIDNPGIIRLQQENDFDETGALYAEGATDSLLLFYNKKGDMGSEWNWNKTSQPSLYLVSAIDGKRTLIKRRGTEGLWSYQLSPQGKYLVYYDVKRKAYFSYEIKSGIVHNITQHITTTWASDNDTPQASSANIPIAGWLKNDAAVLLYDRHDIWKVSLDGSAAGVNITNRYGAQHNIVFRLGMRDYAAEAIDPEEALLLIAYNNNTKDNGFYRKSLHEKGNPEQLTMGPYIYYTPDGLGFSPQKARDAEIYVICRERADSSPNYFYTKDFRSFTALSDIYPEKNYNWLTSVLVKFKTLDGAVSKGVLYKPEDFDHNKKYPVIIHYYERMSDELHQYKTPGFSSDHINIPWFVSHGYLVFTPDIHYTIGEPGQSALNSIAGAAKHLSSFSWIDAKHMAIQSHSFGGFETNYIITHTNLFACAVTSAGVCDNISWYGSTIKQGPSLQFFAENHQTRIGKNLWERPDLFIKNSPVFQADKVTTPILMLSNKEDAIVHFAQGVEFFTALRRLGKKAWMLQYDGEAHSLLNEKSKIDYTIRMTQFFDHYLKGAPAPKWMTRGIPAKMKGIDDGLELDHEITTPGKGLLTDEEKKKVEALQNRKPVTVTIE